MIIVADKHSIDYNQIHFGVEFAIGKGKMGESKRLAHEMSRTVQDNEPDTITYQFISIKTIQSALYMKPIKIWMLCLLIVMALHLKQYFQKFLQFQR